MKGLRYLRRGLSELGLISSVKLTYYLSRKQIFQIINNSSDKTLLHFASSDKTLLHFASLIIQVIKPFCILLQAFCKNTNRV